MYSLLVNYMFFLLYMKKKRKVFFYKSIFFFYIIFSFLMEIGLFFRNLVVKFFFLKEGWFSNFK